MRSIDRVGNDRTEPSEEWECYLHSQPYPVIAKEAREKANQRFISC
jgi:hypothetical protein